MVWRMKHTGVFTVITVVLCALGLAASALAAVTPAQLVTRSLAAADKQRSVHYVSVSSFGQARVTMVCDAALDRGIQRITYTKGGATGHVVVAMVGRALAIRGDKTALTAYMGFSSQLAAQIAGSWVAVPTTAKGYATIAEAVELGSAISDLAIPGPVTRLAASTRSGRRVNAARGNITRNGVTVVATLYMRASGAPLPVAQVSRQGSSTATVTFSRWNETVTIPRVAPKFVLR